MNPLLARLVVPLLALGLAAPAWALPRIAIGREKPLDAGNVGDTFLAEAEGRRWFFKKDGAIDQIQRYGNFEAEILLPRIFDRLGILAPQVRLVEVEGRTGAFMQAELVDAAFTGGGTPVPLKEWATRADLAALDLDEVRLLQLVDVLVGNGDRHDGNLFVVEYPGKPSRVVPIDNNLALATPRVVVGFYNWHLTAGFDGVVPGREPGDPGDLLFPNHAPACGRPERILRRNQLYELVWTESGRIRGGMESYLRLAEGLARALDDGFLEELGRTLAPDEVTGAEYRARVDEILRLLRSRRDRLAAWFRDFALAADARARVGLPWLERHLPPGLFDRLGLPARAKAYLGLRMFEGERFLPADAYFHLRAAGVEVLAAREVVLALAREQGLPNPLKELIQAERGPAAFGRAEAMAKLFAGLPATRFAALYGAETGPVRFAEARAGRDRLTLHDARGRELSKEEAGALGLPLKRAMKEAGLRPGERLALERDAFGAGTYRAWVLDARGRLRWRGRI